MVVEIKGYSFLIDDGMMEAISNEYSWMVQPESRKQGSGAYIYRLEKRDANGKRKRQYMHRILVNAQPGSCVDHINGNTLDNRLCNLRITDRHGNQRNKIGTSSTGFKGVSFDSFTGRYQAKISVDGKTVMLGRRDTPEEASLLYREAAIKYYGEYARFDCKNKQDI